MLSLAGFVAFVYLGLCAVLYGAQRSMIYFPQPRTPGADTKTLTLAVDQAEVLVTVRPREGPKALIYFGGNAEDVSHSVPDLAKAFPDHALYLPHYRGYGGSSGKPSEAALFSDALALFDRIRAEHAGITLIGRSLGSGVAVYVASRRSTAGLALVTPYYSIEDLAARQFPYLPIRWLLTDKFESWKYAPEVAAPTLIIAAEHDEIVPRASTQSLHARFRPGIASLRTVAGASHNTISASPEYHALLKSLP